MAEVTPPCMRERVRVAAPDLITKKRNVLPSLPLRRFSPPTLAAQPGFDLLFLLPWLWTAHLCCQSLVLFLRRLKIPDWEKCTKTRRVSRHQSTPPGVAMSQHTSAGFSCQSVRNIPRMLEDILRQSGSAQNNDRPAVSRAKHSATAARRGGCCAPGRLS